jgi:hypothetical protein
MADQNNPLGSGRGAPGNKGGVRSLDSIAPHRGQQQGSTRNPATVPAGGPLALHDPPGNRQGMIGTTADPNQRRPFRLNATQERALSADSVPVGSAGDDDLGDTGDDPEAQG